MITQKTIDPGVINVMSLECDCLRIQKVKGQGHRSRNVSVFDYVCSVTHRTFDIH